MAPRRTSKVQSRQKPAPEAEGVATVLPNGESGASSNATNGNLPGFDQIQRRAYELFVARGGSHGWDWADWFTAEQQLTATSAVEH